MNLKKHKQSFGKNTKIGCDLVDGKLIYAGCLAKRIAEWKKNLKSKNQDYLTGYMSGLSVVEGMIADMPAIPAIPVEWLRNLRKDERATLDDVESIDWILAWWQQEQEAQDG